MKGFQNVMADVLLLMDGIYDQEIRDKLPKFGIQEPHMEITISRGPQGRILKFHVEKRNLTKGWVDSMDCVKKLCSAYDKVFLDIKIYL